MSLSSRIAAILPGRGKRNQDCPPESHAPIGQVFTRYLASTRACRNPESQEVIAVRLHVIAELLSNSNVLSLANLDGVTYAALVDRLRARGLSDYTIFDYAGTLKTVVRWAVKRELIPPRLLNDMRLPAPQQGRERFLSLSEIVMLMGYLSGQLLVLPAALGIYEGLRRGEVCRLRVNDLELRENRLTVRLSKNRDWRTIQLHPRLLQYLPVPLPEREWLCVTVSGKQWAPRWLGHSFRTEVLKMGKGWQDVTFHTLRHTCASQMAASGRHTLYEIAKFLGHRTVQTTAKYAHLLPGQVRPDW